MQKSVAAEMEAERNLWSIQEQLAAANAEKDQLLLENATANAQLERARISEARTSQSLSQAQERLRMANEQKEQVVLIPTIVHGCVVKEDQGVLQQTCFVMELTRVVTYCCRWQIEKEKESVAQSLDGLRVHLHETESTLADAQAQVALHSFWQCTHLLQA